MAIVFILIKKKIEKRMNFMSLKIDDFTLNRNEYNRKEKKSILFYMNILQYYGMYNEKHACLVCFPWLNVLKAHFLHVGILHWRTKRLNILGGATLQLSCISNPYPWPLTWFFKLKAPYCGSIEV